MHYLKTIGSQTTSLDEYEQELGRRGTRLLARALVGGSLDRFCSMYLLRVEASIADVIVLCRPVVKYGHGPGTKRAVEHHRHVIRYCKPMDPVCILLAGNWRRTFAAIAVEVPCCTMRVAIDRDLADGSQPALGGDSHS